MSTKKVNPFDIFTGTTEHKAKIKALNDVEVTYRTFTMAESDFFKNMMIKGVDENGNPIMDVDAVSDVKYHKISAMLIYPKMSVEELKALPATSKPAIDELLALVSGDDEEEEEAGKN